MTRIPENRLPARRQRGIVLVVALLILMVMTVIGTSMLGTASLEERMASNLQTANSTFQAADSCFRNTINAPLGNGVLPQPTPVMNAALDNINVPQINTCQDPATGQNLYGAGYNVSATLVHPGGYINLEGYDPERFIGRPININVSAAIPNTGTSTTLNIRGGVLVPAP